MNHSAPSRRIAAVCGLIGPVAFVGAWALGGAAAEDYEPIRQPISDLAAIGAPTRVLMTAGMATFGITVPIYAQALRRWIDGPSWIAATICGVATLGVAAVPLGWFSDGLHGAFAGVGYAALALAPLLAFSPLRRRGARSAAALSLAAGAASAMCLVASALVEDPGLFQRVGLLIGDVWIATTAIAMLRTAPRPARDRRPVVQDVP